jgi:hypothetical protein
MVVVDGVMWIKSEQKAVAFNAFRIPDMRLIGALLHTFVARPSSGAGDAATDVANSVTKGR